MSDKTETGTPPLLTRLKCKVYCHQWEQDDHGYAECQRCRALIFGGYVDK